MIVLELLVPVQVLVPLAGVQHDAGEEEHPGDKGRPAHVLLPARRSGETPRQRLWVIPEGCVAGVACATLRNRPPALHVVVTGRNAPQELLDLADLVTEMKPLKHPFEQGERAQPGIDF